MTAALRRFLGPFLGMFVVAVTLSTSLVVLVGVRPAAACSCAGADVFWFIENTEAGFIGTLEGTREERFAGDDWASVANRFSVEAWIHGDLDDAEIDVWAPQGGGACGLELRVGQTAAIFLDRRGNKFTSSLCSTVDEGVVRAALAPEPLPGGQARFAVPGVFPGGGMALLDESGLLIGYDARFDFEWSPQVLRCPEGRRALLVGADQALLVDLDDLSIVKAVDLEGLQQTVGVRAVDCADPEGTSIQMLVEGNRASDLRRLEKVGRPGRTIGQGATGGLLIVAGEHIVVQTYLDPGERLEVIDLDGTQRTVANLLRSGVDSYRGYSDIQARPGDGAVVAVLEIEYTDFARSRLWLLDPATGKELASRNFAAEAWQLRWLDTDRVVLSVASGERGASEIIDAATLETITTIDNFSAFDPVLFGDALFGTQSAEVWLGSFDGSSEQVETLPSQQVGPMLLLGQPIDVEPSERSGIVLRPVVQTKSTADGDASLDAPLGVVADRFPLLIAIGGSVAVVVATALAFVLLQRRRSAHPN
ncbi:MAG: hypothetical protein ACRBK7_26845 [Acidimicrobiales bacterium]